MQTRRIFSRGLSTVSLQSVSHDLGWVGVTGGVWAGRDGVISDMGGGASWTGLGRSPEL